MLNGNVRHTSNSEQTKNNIANVHVVKTVYIGNKIKAAAVKSGYEKKITRFIEEKKL